jgi:4-amino-4-deoxy-L-arabinose transferase-like glycosyltransferase
MESNRQQFKFDFAHTLLLVAILVGSLLRFVDLKQIPPGFNQDEAVNGYDAYSLFVTGRDHHGHPFPFAGLESFGDWASPLLTFVTAPAVGVLGLHVEVVRGVAGALGVLSIPLIYILACKLFKRRAFGIAAAFAIALSPWAVDRSRFANPSASVPIMVVLTMLALIWTMQQRSDRGIVALGVIAGLAIATYPTMKLYIPLLLIAGFLIYARTLRHFKKESLLYAAILFGIIAGPIMYLSLFDPGGGSRLEQVSVFNSGQANPLFIAQQYKSYFSPWVFFIAGNGHPGQSATPPGWGVELISSIPFLLAGALWLVFAVTRPSRPFERQGALFLIAALALYPIPGSLTVPTPPLVNPHLSRGIHLIPLLALVDGIGAAVLIDLARRGWRSASLHVGRYISIFLLIGLFSAAALELAFRYQDYFNSYPFRSDAMEYFQYGLENVLAYVQVHQSEYDEIWITDVNQPYIYVLFYNKWPPSDVHQNLQVLRAPPNFNQVDAFDKYHFGDLPNDDFNDLALLYSLQAANGNTLYQVRGGVIPARGRVLLVNKP